MTESTFDFDLFVITGKEVGETVMFFGCRHKNEDYLYQEELEEAEKNEVLTQLNVAFSRDQEQKVWLSDQTFSPLMNCVGKTGYLYVNIKVYLTFLSCLVVTNVMLMFPYCICSQVGSLSHSTHILRFQTFTISQPPYYWWCHMLYLYCLGFKSPYYRMYLSTIISVSFCWFEGVRAASDEE